MAEKKDKGDKMVFNRKKVTKTEETTKTVGKKTPSEKGTKKKPVVKSPQEKKIDQLQASIKKANEEKEKHKESLKKLWKENEDQGKELISLREKKQDLEAGNSTRNVTIILLAFATVVFLVISVLQTNNVGNLSASIKDTVGLEKDFEKEKGKNRNLTMENQNLTEERDNLETENKNLKEEKAPGRPRSTGTIEWDELMDILEDHTSGARIVVYSDSYSLYKLEDYVDKLIVIDDTDQMDKGIHDKVDFVFTFFGRFCFWPGWTKGAGGVVLYEGDEKTDFLFVPEGKDLYKFDPRTDEGYSKVTGILEAKMVIFP